MSPRRLVVAAAMLGLVPTAGAQAACLRVGVYQDDPMKTLAPLQSAVGPGVRTISTYVTAGRPIDPKLIALANKKRLTLLVSWLPDSGKDGARQGAYRLAAVAHGKFDPSLKLLAGQMRKTRLPVIFRPMPEPNTPWYAWSGTVNGNAPSSYPAAWKHVRSVIRSAGAKRVQFLWTPYARSIPDTPANAISSYFPGARQVDLVGTDAYNFGSANGQTWILPADLFTSAYAAIEKLAPKPFWIAETGSTAAGGDQAAWMAALANLTSTLPRLAGIVWYDIKEPNGDFRLRANPATTAAFKDFLRSSCR